MSLTVLLQRHDNSRHKLSQQLNETQIVLESALYEQSSLTSEISTLAENFQLSAELLREKLTSPIKVIILGECRTTKLRILSAILNRDLTLHTETKFMTFPVVFEDFHNISNHHIVYCGKYTRSSFTKNFNLGPNTREHFVVFCVLTEETTLSDVDQEIIEMLSYTNDKFSFLCFLPHESHSQQIKGNLKESLPPFKFTITKLPTSRPFYNSPLPHCHWIFSPCPQKTKRNVKLYSEQSLTLREASLSQELSTIQDRCLKCLTSVAYLLTHSMSLTPRRFAYAKDKEWELFQRLISHVDKIQPKLVDLVEETVLGRSGKIREKIIKRTLEFAKCPPDKFAHLKQAGEMVDLLVEVVSHELGVMAHSIIEDHMRTLSSYCVDIIEKSVSSLSQECHEKPSSIAALKQIINLCYNVNISVDSSTFFNWFTWKVVRFSLSFSLRFSSGFNREVWLQKITDKLLRLASPRRFAQQVCCNFRLKLISSHKSFTSNIQKMESNYQGQAERHSILWSKINKNLVPKLSLLHLKSSSIRDLAIRGRPQLGEELGRGHFGIVYSCKRWGEYSSCAVKTLSPSGDKQIRDVAIEIYYGRSLPLNEHVVEVLGTTLIQDDVSTSICIVYKKYEMDLSRALKRKMSLERRMKIALEVAEGIRFIHSQGHIHRDIKLSNIMLDSEFHARLTDMGFCKPTAMISGTICGTPIHMSPELLSGKYGNKVDIFAFGILFWFLCSGCCNMPNSYQHCDSAPELLTMVSKGQRPERLDCFNDDMWQLMMDCWATDSCYRPHIGEVEMRLWEIFENVSTTHLN